MYNHPSRKVGIVEDLVIRDIVPVWPIPMYWGHHGADAVSCSLGQGIRGLSCSQIGGKHLPMGAGQDAESNGRKWLVYF